MRRRGRSRRCTGRRWPRRSAPSCASTSTTPSTPARPPPPPPLLPSVVPGPPSRRRRRSMSAALACDKALRPRLRPRLNPAEPARLSRGRRQSESRPRNPCAPALSGGGLAWRRPPHLPSPDGVRPGASRPAVATTQPVLGRLHKVHSNANSRVTPSRRRCRRAGAVDRKAFQYDAGLSLGKVMGRGGLGCRVRRDRRREDGRVSAPCLRAARALWGPGGSVLGRQDSLNAVPGRTLSRPST